MSLWLWFTISITMHSHHQSINCFHLKSTFHVECIQNSHVCDESDICSELVAGMPFDPLKCLWSQGPLQFCGTLVGLMGAGSAHVIEPNLDLRSSHLGDPQLTWGICCCSDEDYVCKKKIKKHQWENGFVVFFEIGMWWSPHCGVSDV